MLQGRDSKSTQFSTNYLHIISNDLYIIGKLLIGLLTLGSLGLLASNCNYNCNYVEIISNYVNVIVVMCLACCFQRLTCVERLKLFQYPFHPRVTVIARKRSRPYCQKCSRWQVTAKNTCTLPMCTAVSRGTIHVHHFGGLKNRNRSKKAL